MLDYRAVWIRTGYMLVFRCLSKNMQLWENWDLGESSSGGSILVVFNFHRAVHTLYKIRVVGVVGL